MRFQASFAPFHAALLVSVVACKDPAPGSTTGSTTTGEPTTASTTSSTTSTSPTTSTTGAPTSTGGTSTSDSGAFTVMPDLPPVAPCDVWNDTCPRGQKCVPYAGPLEMPGCVDIADDPLGLGEPCDEEAQPDQCEAGTLCDGSAQGGDSGRCLATCEGSPDEAECADVCSNCFIDGTKSYGVCPVLCDPRAPACPEHLSCIIIPFAPNFLCRASSKLSVPAGMPCTGIFDCVEGTACIPAMFLPACDGDQCCTPVCDLNGPDTCSTSVPDAVCNPWPLGNPEFELSCLLDGLGLCGAPM
ncbi:hypothetical protein [Nannocystis sp. SCPEA4]|uniref:hypothetical protein n=1 Tax=Nannocystis sp. SCPEA4 TaxID=2996787 RepID=UPI00226F837B|nr:hypothetical protein [Nannocystis sp. SCPEA4]MCY1054740.1 hypothetical protein [Nannocystis sp. SCPEA4]